jgi:hypothetical protein
MKIFLTMLSFAFAASSVCQASLYSYPEKKRPAISLIEACQIAQKMLKTQKDDKRYFITEVNLLGDKEQSGWGAWNLWHYDAKGNKVNVYIPFPTGKPSLNYYPYNYSTKGGEREVEFDSIPK